MSFYYDYSEVPYFRKQWFFWLMYFTISPVAIGILLTGDVFYERGGELRSFGTANRVVAGLIGIGMVIRIYQLLMGHGELA